MLRRSLLLVFLLTTVNALAAPRRWALLVGINDYSASRFGGRVAASRDWADLGGAVRDVDLMRDMLMYRYRFAPDDIVVLKNQDATRAAILTRLEHLQARSQRGDITFFYFSGHGSQVVNTLTDEQDGKDESIVPADAPAGARDIRDKELRRIFNGILDRGARLTVLLDSCHSGSGARGFPTGGHPRGVKPDLRDAADGSDAGPRPENRGALVLSATGDDDLAWETHDAEGNAHGVFSWAWIQAMRDAGPGEAAIDTFLAAQARMRAQTPFQTPVIAGTDEMRLTPFLSAAGEKETNRSTIAIEKVERDGTVLLQGGWAHGLTVGSRLRAQQDPNVVLEVTAMLGLGRSEARAVDGHTPQTSLSSGTLLEMAGWAAPPADPLRVWIPRTSRTIGSIVTFARRVRAAALKAGVRWVDDPVSSTPTHVLRWRNDSWEIVSGSSVVVAGADPDVAGVIRQIGSAAVLFVQLPAPDESMRAITRDANALQVVSDPVDADYILAGRLHATAVEYSWIRPLLDISDQSKTALPLRSDWASGNNAVLRNAALRLHRIHAWSVLESPPQSLFPYRLGIRRARDQVPANRVVEGNADYDLVLRSRTDHPPDVVPRRYVYVFLLDSFGSSILLYPLPSNGSVENQFPLTRDHPPREIPLGSSAIFGVTEPYGMDTYYLLTTDEALPNPWILQSEGVRRRGQKSPLEELLESTGDAMRSAKVPRTSVNWSIERLVLESIPPQRTAP